MITTVEGVDDNYPFETITQYITYRRATEREIYSELGAGARGHGNQENQMGVRFGWDQDQTSRIRTEDRHL